jgi:hypothetical protein
LTFILQCQLRFSAASIFLCLSACPCWYPLFHRASLHLPSCFEASEVRQAPGSPTKPLLMPGAAQEMADSCAVRCAHRTGASIFCPPSPSRQQFCFDEVGWHASAPLGVCCCSLSFSWPDPVSILSNPLFGTPALVSCTHPHAKLRFLSGLSHAHTHLRYTFAPFPRSIHCEAAATRSRRWYISSAALPTPVAQLARVGAALEARRLIRPSHAPVWRTAGLLLEREQEIFHARRDRASGRTLVGRHAGSMPPS